MCLAVPGRLVEWVEREPLLASGWVEFEGLRRLCHLACTPEAEVGDYLLVHAGIAIGRIDAGEALRLLDDLKRGGEATAPESSP